MWANSTSIHTSLWFVPVLMIFGAIGLALGSIQIDARLNLELQESYLRSFGVKAEGSRTILSTIAASVIAIAGVP